MSGKKYSPESKVRSPESERRAPCGAVRIFGLVGYPFDSGNPNPLWVEVVETRAGAARSALLGPEWRPVRAWTRKSL